MTLCHALAVPYTTADYIPFVRGGSEPGADPFPGIKTFEQAQIHLFPAAIPRGSDGLAPTSGHPLSSTVFALVEEKVFDLLYPRNRLLSDSAKWGSASQLRLGGSGLGFENPRTLELGVE